MADIKQEIDGKKDGIANKDTLLAVLKFLKENNLKVMHSIVYILDNFNTALHNDYRKRAQVIVNNLIHRPSQGQKAGLAIGVLFNFDFNMGSVTCGLSTQHSYYMQKNSTLVINCLKSRARHEDWPDCLSPPAQGQGPGERQAYRPAKNLFIGYLVLVSY